MEEIIMNKIKDSNLEEYLKDMEEYTEKVKKMSKEESIRALIRIGVLDTDGQPKEQICTGENFGG